LRDLPVRHVFDVPQHEDLRGPIRKFRQRFSELLPKLLVADPVQCAPVGGNQLFRFEPSGILPGANYVQCGVYGRPAEVRLRI
jgi:hypothetical protein